MEKPKRPDLFSHNFNFDFTALERRFHAVQVDAKRQVEKQRLHTGRFGADAFIKGVTAHTLLHDELIAEFKTFNDYGVNPGDLSTEEWRWAIALRRVYNVTSAYFEEQPPKKRAEIIKNLTALAEKNGRAGLKAAEAVGIVVELTLERREPSHRPVIDLEAQMDAYSYMFGTLTSMKKEEPK